MTNSVPNEIESLIEKAGEKGAQASIAALRLVEIGSPAAPLVVEAIRRSKPMPSDQLMDIIPEMRAPEIVPLMIQLLRDSNPFVAVVAARALGSSKDSRAFEPLVNLVCDETLSITLRGWAADALAELGDARAVPELLGIVRAIAAKRKLKEQAQLVRFITVALAKLGNQDAAEIAISMVSHRVRYVREEGALTLKHVVGRGLFSALHLALRSKSKTVRDEAIDSISFLGLRESIKELIAVVEDDGSDWDLMLNALYRLRGLTGEEFDEADQWRDWWTSHQSEFTPSVCYRMGKPLDMKEFVSLLQKAEPLALVWLLEELYIITGERFGLQPFKLIEEQDETLTRAQNWLSENADRFERGVVYKYGHKQVIRHVFESSTVETKRDFV